MSLAPDTPKLEKEIAESKPAAPSIDIDKAPKTPGERFYDLLQFTVGKLLIVVVTAALAYIGKYGQDKYFGWMPNYLKRFQQWVHKGMLKNPVFSLEGKGEWGPRLAEAISNTMLLFHGGNMFAFVMKPLENGREQIANWYNRHWGKPGDVEITHERYKNIAKQSWGDVIKGRLGAWGIVFTSFAGLDALAHKNKKSGLYHFDHYEEWFGRWIAGFTKSGEAIGKIPVGQPLNKLQSENKIYRFSKIVALDFYATSAGIIIWNLISRLSAQKRHNKKNGNGTHAADSAIAALTPSDDNPFPNLRANLNAKHADGMEPRSPAALAKGKPPDKSHVGAVASRRQGEGAEQTLPGMG